MILKVLFTLLLTKVPKPAGVAMAKVRIHPKDTVMEMPIKKMKFR